MNERGPTIFSKTLSGVGTSFVNAVFDEDINAPFWSGQVEEIRVLNVSGPGTQCDVELQQVGVATLTLTSLDSKPLDMSEPVGPFHYTCNTSQNDIRLRVKTDDATNSTDLKVQIVIRPAA